MAENLDVTGDYWMDLVHTFAAVNASDDVNAVSATNMSGTGSAWWMTREPMIENPPSGWVPTWHDGRILSWVPGKFWCEASGTSFPLSIPVLVVENDVEFPDSQSIKVSRRPAPRSAFPMRFFRASTGTLPSACAPPCTFAD